MAAKKNKDGLIGGVLVSEQDHNRITREKRVLLARKSAEAAIETTNTKSPDTETEE